MRKLVRKNIMTPEIPTGTFADIAFLLLVFFMLTTVIAITRGIWFKVPEQAPPDEQPPEKNPAIYMFVNEAGSLVVDKKPMTLNEIKSYCQKKLLINQTKPIIIHCSGNQQYEKMIAVLDKVKQLENDMWGDFNKGKPLKEQKRIKVMIPSLEEAEYWQNM